ncbi:MAG: transporter substrate-binding domain-containing protein [Deltaproteobacteria bacterium]|nr:transporter substrate-binding domain-containing protein [Deltaproteobacteria bacterium]
MKREKITFLFIIPTVFLSSILLFSGTGRSQDAGVKQIVVRGDDSYPPYEFLDDDGQPVGFNIDVIRSIAIAMGVELKLRLGPWKEVRGDLEAGNIDALSGMYYSKERDRLVDFSQPHIVVTYAVFIPRGSPIRSIDDIQERRVVVQEGDIGDDYLTTKKLGTRIIRVENPASALRLLSAGEADCALLPRLMGLYLITRHGFTNVEAVGSPVLERKYCFAVRQGAAGLLTVLNEGLKIIQETGQYDRIYSKWFGVYEKRSSFRNLMRYAFWIVSPLLILLGLALAWTRSLKRTVAGKTAELTHELAKRERIEAALRESEDKYRMLVDNALDPIFILQDEVMKFANPVTLKLSGYTIEELGRQPFTILLYPEDRERILNLYHRCLKGEDMPSNLVLRITNKKKRELSLESKQVLIQWNGRPAILIIARDVTFQRQVEEQLRHSQKMEAVGTLAGGIAHDFNNILMAIIGYSELAMDKARTPERGSREIEGALEAAVRAKSLVEQILTFSRKTETKLTPLNLNGVLEQSVKMLERTIPKMIRIETKLDKTLKPVMGDAGQLNQLLLNLGSNAADAMPQGGSLRITSGNLVPDAVTIKNRIQLEPGEYAMVEVTDTGHGMDEEIIERIFDPFFTTKEVGKGTGLGLSAAFGVVKAHGGHITCSSRPGAGATFTLFLPVLKDATVPMAETETVSCENGRGSETVLVVDDEEALRDIGRKILEKNGYQVIEASTGEDALAVFETNGDRVDLVLVDLGMPGMGGLKCIEALRRIKPRLKIVITSGYALGESEQRLVSLGKAAFVAKPYALGDLLHTIRTVLDGDDQRPSPSRLRNGSF